MSSTTPNVEKLGVKNTTPRSKVLHQGQQKVLDFWVTKFTRVPSPNDSWPISKAHFLNIQE